MSRRVHSRTGRRGVGRGWLLDRHGGGDSRGATVRVDVDLTGVPLADAQTRRVGDQLERHVIAVKVAVDWPKASVLKRLRCR